MDDMIWNDKTVAIYRQGQLIEAKKARHNAVNAAALRESRSRQSLRARFGNKWIALRGGFRSHYTEIDPAECCPAEQAPVRERL